MSEPPKKGMMASFFSSVLEPFREKESVVLLETDSEYGHITVTEKSNVRTLFMGPFGLEAETSMNVDDPDAPVFEYPGLMFMSLPVCDLNTDILLVGLGGGYIPRLFQNYLPRKNLTVVEIDPTIVDISERFFNFTPGKNVKIEVRDGLEYISSAPKAHFDQIWMDAFDGNYIPEHLASEEFLEICRYHIKPGGLLVQNLHATKKERYFEQLLKTARVFGESPMIFNGKRCANSVLMSHNSPPGRHPLTSGIVLNRVKERLQTVGPYDLRKEARKLIKLPSLP
ncbi:MAG: fused MFS/spermidine synthase [Deltaproteobacteria bacterium]|jgi:spermidine synthase|nr:fused MFS/spermidine synthase [Deltaproteobacteria bacterium]